MCVCARARVREREGGGERRRSVSVTDFHFIGSVLLTCNHEALGHAAGDRLCDVCGQVRSGPLSSLQLSVGELLSQE